MFLGCASVWWLRESALDKAFRVPLPSFGDLQGNYV